MLTPKKIHTRNLITKKIPAARKFPTLPRIPPPPHNFSNGPSLTYDLKFTLLRERASRMRDFFRDDSDTVSLGLSFDLLPNNIF